MSPLSSRQPVTLGWLSQSYSCDDGVGEGQQSQASAAPTSATALITKMAEIRVPEELQPILRDFTKAVLRERPEDVLLFSRDYFVAKWSEQRMGALTCLHAHQLLPPAASLTEPSL